MLTEEKQEQIKTAVDNMLKLDDQGRAIMMAVGSALLSRQMMGEKRCDVATNRDNSTRNSLK